MRLLFVHEVNWKTKPVFEIHDYPELLSIRGHNVYFLEFPENEKLRGFFKFDTFRTKKASNLTRAHKGSSVEVITPGRICGAPFDRLLHSVTFVPLLLKTIRRTNCQAIVLYGVPTNGWQTILVAKMLNIPVLFRAIDVSHKIRKSIFWPLIVLAEKYVYKRSTFISANNESLRDHCVKYGAKDENISVDYPGLDLEHFKPETTDLNLKTSLGFGTDDKVILFMGTLYRFAGLSKFLELIEETLKLDRQLKVLIIGDGEALLSIKETVVRLDLQNHVAMPGFVKYDELSKYLNLADIAINTFEPSAVTDSALPWKVVQYLACGLPTISTPLRGLTAYTGDNSGAIVYKKLDSSFVDAICELVEDQNHQISLSIKARELVVYRSSWANCIIRFENLITSLVAEK